MYRQNSLPLLRNGRCQPPLNNLDLLWANVITIRSHFKDFGKIAAPLMEHLKGATEGSRKLNLN